MCDCQKRRKRIGSINSGTMLNKIKKVDPVEAVSVVGAGAVGYAAGRIVSGFLNTLKLGGTTVQDKLGGPTVVNVGIALVGGVTALVLPSKSKGRKRGSAQQAFGAGMAIGATTQILEDNIAEPVASALNISLNGINGIGNLDYIQLPMFQQSSHTIAGAANNYRSDILAMDEAYVGGVGGGLAPAHNIPSL